VLGVEPAANVARAAQAKGIPTRVAFFGRGTAQALRAEGGAADLIVANNVLAHVPTLNDFVAGVGALLAAEGVATFEFPHLLRLMQGGQFDTLYHEHFSYFSLLALEKVFARHALRVFDLEELSTHGGSLRLYVCHADARTHPAATAPARVLREERAARLDSLEGYRAFEDQARAARRSLLEFLEGAKREGKRVAGYGAAAKGNTLLNYCGIRADAVEYVADRSPHKQGRFLPGSRIPVVHPDRIRETRPDYLLVLPWNLKDEVMQANAGIRAWGGRFVVPIPTVALL
jgi:hypothetical protein